MPQLIRLITLSHIYSAANNKAGTETGRGKHASRKAGDQQLAKTTLKSAQTSSAK